MKTRRVRSQTWGLRGNAPAVGEAKFSLGRSGREALSVSTTCSDSRKQSSWQVLADTEHGGGLAPVFLVDRFQDGYEVLEGRAK